MQFAGSANTEIGKIKLPVETPWPHFSGHLPAGFPIGWFWFGVAEMMGQWTRSL
ncbi:MAG: hypothetical protein QOH34_2366, partial [Mycobacterium sp.]|nr:hypothetical protein [Mycobacterium sp.]